MNLALGSAVWHPNEANLSIWTFFIFSILDGYFCNLKLIISLFQAAADKPTFIEKPVKGDKNGGKRMVRVKRLRNDVPTIEK